jgi:YVTN family beta-propeller protein
MRGFLVALSLAVLTTTAGAQFVTFETGQVRPLALSPDQSKLFAINTPDARLEIFSVDGGTGALTHTGSVPVGMEPIAVAARTNTEVWVVNHLSDSISIVDVGATPPRVTRTLLVGDEPRDIVFAGPGGNRAFITTAHRGQNTSLQSTIHTVLTTEGIGRADVWVFDATSLGATLGGTPLTVITLFGDTPRALAASADGSTVYAAVFHSGNQTTALSEGAVCDGGPLAPACALGPGGLPRNSNCFGEAQAEVGLVV